MEVNTLHEQRQTLFDVIDPVYSGSVYKYPQGDSVTPPCVIFQRVIMEFPESSKLAMIGWELLMYEARTEPSSAVVQLENDLEAILLSLSKGAGISFVLTDVSSIDPITSGLPFPGYQILGTSPFRNC